MSCIVDGISCYMRFFGDYRVNYVPLQPKLHLIMLNIANMTQEYIPNSWWVLNQIQGQIQGGPQGPGPPLTTKNEAPAPKFYKTEAPEWQF